VRHSSCCNPGENNNEGRVSWLLEKQAALIEVHLGVYTGPVLPMCSEQSRTQNLPKNLFLFLMMETAAAADAADAQ
jgi:hypothetical protein